MAIATGPHPFPFRTRKLSLSAPMVLGGIPPGRVGRRRIFSMKKPPPRGGGFFAFLDHWIAFSWRLGVTCSFGAGRSSSTPCAPVGRSLVLRVRFLGRGPWELDETILLGGCQRSALVCQGEAAIITLHLATAAPYKGSIEVPSLRGGSAGHCCWRTLCRRSRCHSSSPRRCLSGRWPIRTADSPSHGC